MICGAALAAMSTAGISHWCSVRQIVAAAHAGVPLSSTPAATATPPPPKASAPRVLAQAAPAPAAVPATDATQKQFFEALIAKMEGLQNQNRDLLNQVAETNRDMMNLNFRVDTFSDSFRPLPVSEDRPDLSYETGPGVLPPRAEPVILLPFDQ